MPNLFIEGPIQTGKSTLIRSALSPYKSILAGFSTQRLLEASASAAVPEAGDTSESGCSAPCKGLKTPDLKVAAYRIAPPCSPVNAVISDVVPKWPDISRSELAKSGIFKAFMPDGTVNLDEIFDRLAVDLASLTVSPSSHGNHSTSDSHEADTMPAYPVIVLDEIGGFELGNEKFLKVLHDLIAGPVPCIGVIKHPDNMHRLSQDIVQKNLELHEFIRAHDGQVLNYDRFGDGEDAARAALRNFIDSAF